MQRISVAAEFMLGELQHPVPKLDLIESIVEVLEGFGGMDIVVEILDVEDL